MKDKAVRGVPPELAEEHDEFVDDAVGLARGTLSPERAAAVRERMAKDPLYRAVVAPIVESYDAPPMAPEELQERWADFRRRAGLSPIASDGSSALADFEARVRAREGRVRRFFLRAAAVLVILMAIPLGFWIYADLAFYTKHETAANVTLIIDLADGSTARLSPSSRLVYWKDMKNRVGRTRREVTLEGTADFSVRSIGEPHFQVETNHARVTAVGTQFRVEEHEGFTMVRVQEGRVTVQPLDDMGAPVGQVVTLDAGGAARVLPPSVFLDSQPTPVRKSP